MASPRVLVADASRPVRYLLARLIEEAGYEVVEKADGIETLRALQDTPPTRPYEALVVASMLPLLPARVLLERAQPVLRSTLVLVVTPSRATTLEYRFADLGLEGRAIEAREVCVEVLRALGEQRARR